MKTVSLILCSLLVSSAAFAGLQDFVSGNATIPDVLDSSAAKTYANGMMVLKNPTLLGYPVEADPSEANYICTLLNSKLVTFQSSKMVDGEIFVSVDTVNNNAMSLKSRLAGYYGQSGKITDLVCQ